MAQQFQLPDYGKIFVTSLIIFTFWYFAVTDFLRPYFSQNYTVSYLFFLVIDTALMLYIMGRESGGRIILGPKIYLAFAIMFFIADLFMYPLMVPKDSALPTYTPDAQVSSDIFIYQLLPNELPAVLKYFIVYPVTMAIGLTAVALLVKKKRDFTSVVGRAV